MSGNMATEQQVQKKIINYIESLDEAYVVKVVSATKSGVPDILCCVSGTFVGIEVKRPESRNNVSKLQEYNLNLIEKAGGHSLVAWNTEMVKEFIEEIVL